MPELTAETCKNITEAASPDEIFKGLTEKNKNRAERLKALQDEFEKLRSILEADPADAQTATLEKINEARITLDELYKWAKTKIINEDPPAEETADSSSTEQRTPPAEKTSEIQIATRKRPYYITEATTEGDTTSIYKGYYLEDTSPVDVILKIIKDPADNPFSKREAEALTLLYSEPNNEGRQLKHLPEIVDQFTTSDNQRGNVLTYFDGYNLNQVRAKYKKGIDRKYMVWMFNRLLSVVGYAHSKGVIHGNITPANILIRPRDHNLRLIGWGCSIINRTENGVKFSVFDEEFSAPEIAQRPILPKMAECASQLNAMYLEALTSADLYSIGKCMIYILGGNIKTNKMPGDVELPLQKFIESFTIESPLQRPRDAWEMYGELKKIITKLWGKRKFLEFKM